VLYHLSNSTSSEWQNFLKTELKLGMVMHACNPLGRLRQVDQEFKASLGYKETLLQKKEKKN
jgi:hypothetical protein